MKFLSLPIAALALSALVASAFAADPMAGYYGNTLVVSGPKGERKMMYNADHTYSSTDAEGKAASGTWEVKGAELCTTRLQPPPDKPNDAHCRPLAADKKAGDSWQAPGRNGETMTFKVVAGR